MGLFLSKTCTDLLLFSVFFPKRFPFVSVQLANSVSRTGRHSQRYDSKGYRQVVGCIPYRYRETNCQSSSIEDLEVLVISSQKGQGMMFPKGGWETDETVEDAAMRETQEEAGVVGKVENCLGNWQYKSKRQNIMHEVYMFSLLVNDQLDRWPEKNLRERRWMTVAEAREVCQHGWMKEALDVLVSQQLQPEEKSRT
ncbi:hypothetical protein F2P56_034603 [Juglans regia]|uniref:Nudix hydrolase domain-containing protein n=2 Tax=Juglans regia TaxID=51240 RepID=A0A833TR69_JUGRE|nr:nudix hydrolase 4-like [Juglans regia]KAF5445557.1 hypothetical protein F2P56_034603 [Juglans regia]